MARKILLIDVGDDVRMQAGSGVAHVAFTLRQRQMTNVNGAGTNSGACISLTPGRTAGKLFARLLFKSAGVNQGVYFGVGQVGCNTSSNPATTSATGVPPAWAYYSGITPAGTSASLIHQAAATTSGITRATAGQYIDIAADLNAGNIWFGLGTSGGTTWFNSGNPATGANPAYTNLQTAALLTDNGTRRPAFALLANPFSAASQLFLVVDADQIGSVCPVGFTPWGFVVRAANEDYISSTGDDPANWYWPSRISEDPVYERSMSVHAWQRDKATAALSGAKLDNNDGALDYLKTYELRDLPVTARLGYDFADLSTFTTVGRTVVEEAGLESEVSYRLTFRGKDALLDKPLLTAVYPTTLPATELRGKTIPSAWGLCNWVPVTTIDPANLNYDLTDGPFGYIDHLRDQGIGITQNTGWTTGNRVAQAGVRRMTNPAGKQVVTFSGRHILGSVLLQDDFSAWTGDNPTGWTIVGTETATLKFTQVGTRCACYGDGTTNLAMHKSINVINGSRYWVEIVVSAYTNGHVRLTVAGVEVGRVNALGTHRFGFVANSTAVLTLQIQNVSTLLEIDNIVVTNATEVKNLPDWIEQATTVQTQALVTSEVDRAGTITTLHTAFPATLCHYIPAGNNMTIGEFLRLTLDSYGGGYYFDRLGTLKVGRLVDPAGAASVLTLTDGEIVGTINCDLDTAPGLSDGWAGVPNFGKHDTSDIAGALLSGSAFDRETAAKLQQDWLSTKRTTSKYAAPYQSAIGRTETPTMLSADADVATEANRFGALYTVPRYFYRFTAVVEDSTSYQLEPFQCITVQTNRYGMNAGTKLILVSVRSRFLSNLVEFVAWG